MSYVQGKYKTRAGWDAEVIRVVQEGGCWFADGYIRCPDTGSHVLWSWSAFDGTSDSENPDADLIPNTVGPMHLGRREKFDGAPGACIIPFNAHIEREPRLPEVH